MHFNNAGSSLPTQSTVDSIKQHLDLEASIGGYEAAAQAQDDLQSVYDYLARLIHASNDEIALVNSATDGWNQIFYSIDFKPGDKILTSQSEYASNYLAMLHRAQRENLKIEVIPDNDNGTMDMEAFSRALKDDVRLVAITHVPTNNGIINPAETIGELVSSNQALYLLDACQSVGQLDINVDTIQCDFMTATGRKYLRAPRGTGFIYIRNARINDIHPAQIDMRAAEWVSRDKYQLKANAIRFERWEHSPALRLGLGNALAELNQLGIQSVAERIHYLASELRLALQSINGVRLQDKGHTLSGIVTFSVTSKAAQSVATRLGAENINVSVSPVSMARLDMEPRQLDAVIRASVHYYNTEQEIGTLTEKLHRIVHSS